jgi:glycosyltransferase involved in cell wall biosynthesis
MNLNIVPSNFVKNSINSTSYDIQNEKTKEVEGLLKSEKPIEVLFEGVDTNIYKKTNEFTKLLADELSQVEEEFNFLYVGHWLQGRIGHDRKDTGMLVKVFCETFKNMKNKPALIMKTSSAGFSILDRETMLNKIKEIKSSIKGDLPNIYLLHGDFMDDEINGLYNHPKVKAHVTFTHGEGFGRPLLEASISEKPIIAPKWSGHVDFLDSKSIALEGQLTNVEKGSFPNEFLVDGAQWFTVNYQKASQTLRTVYRSYKKYVGNANKLGIQNKSKFSLDEMTIEFGKILDKYVPEFPKEVKLQLPKLKKVGESEAPKIKLPKLKKV